MGAIGKALTELINKIEDVTLFFISYTLIVFIAGEFVGVIYSSSEAFWYPMYLLLIVMIFKILIDFERKAKKK